MPEEIWRSIINSMEDDFRKLLFQKGKFIWLTIINRAGRLQLRAPESIIYRAWSHPSNIHYERGEPGL